MGKAQKRWVGLSGFLEDRSRDKGGRKLAVIMK